MSVTSLYDLDPEFSVERGGEESDVVLTIRTGNDVIKLNVGHNEESVTDVRDRLAKIVDTLSGEILDGWEDTPEQWDGFVSWEDRYGWTVQLSDKPVSDPRYGFPTLDIAIFELAQAMHTAGEHSNAWVEGEHGPTTRNINDQITQWLNRFDSAPLPLSGVQYAEGDLIEEIVRPDWPMSVDRDYGELGIVIYTSGDPGNREHIKPEHRAMWHRVPGDQ